MKMVNMIKLSLGCILLISSIGCGGGETSNGGSNINKESKNLEGSELAEYMFSNKNAVLNASDCLKFSGQDWSNIYRDIIFHIAPADPMAKSIDSCKAVKLAVEAGYSLEQASSQDIKQGWLNGIVTTNVSQGDYMTAQDQEQQDLVKISNMTHSECSSQFGKYDSQELFFLSMDYMQEASNLENSESEKYKYKMLTRMAAHCRKVLYGE